jgi:preprotein translocase subunit SecA
MLRFLNEVRFGSRTQFDSKHRRVSQRTERFRLTYLVAERAAGWGRDRLEDEVLTHLGDAIAAWEDAWGRRELQRIGAYEWSSLDQETRAGIGEALGGAPFAEPEAKRVSDLSAEQAETVRAYLGRRVLFNVQRQLMLDTTSRYWVEHLTAMEVLRQGIGLQSYAQKDPLAEYKVRAYDMFQELLLAIQSDIVAAMFTYRPRDLSQVRVGVDKGTSRAQPSARRSTSKRSRKRRKKR